MQKQAAFFVILLTFGLLFAGAVSAQEPATVDVAVTNEAGTPVNVTCPGQNVTVAVNASANDEYVFDPGVVISVDPDTGLKFSADDAVMIFNGVAYLNDPEDPFFYLDDEFGWVWWIGWLDDMVPGDEAQLYLPAKVTDIGKITVTADFYTWPEEVEYPILLDSDSYTFLSVPCHPCHGATVPMQATGTPIALAALGLLGIIGGTLYGRLR